MSRNAPRLNTGSSSGVGEPMTRLERLQVAREVLRQEAAAILSLVDSATAQIVQAAEWIAACEGSVMVTGIGKAGIIGQKIAATLASTGSPAHFLHPAEAIHGDLGRLTGRDLVWVFSYSGRSEELVRLLPSFQRVAAGTIATTASARSPIGGWAQCLIAIGEVDEACGMGLAPSSSTAMMLASGDAVALLASRLRGFTERDFARYHPGGSLGRKLSTVDQWMRPLEQCRVSAETRSVREVFSSASASAAIGGGDATSGGALWRRTGAVMLVDEAGRLSGLFTDSDLARLLERRQYDALDGPIREVMTRRVCTITSGTLLGVAIDLLAERKISELPVLSTAGCPVGLLDITDVVAIGEPAAATIPFPGR